jgi:hypothetical protein
MELVYAPECSPLHGQWSRRAQLWEKMLDRQEKSLHKQWSPHVPLLWLQTTTNSGSKLYLFIILQLSGSEIHQVSPDKAKLLWAPFFWRLWGRVHILPFLASRGHLPSLPHTPPISKAGAQNPCPLTLSLLKGLMRLKGSFRIISLF